MYQKRSFLPTTGSTTSSISAAITCLLTTIEPPGSKCFRPGPRLPALPPRHNLQDVQLVPRASLRPLSIKLTGPNAEKRGNQAPPHPACCAARLAEPAFRVTGSTHHTPWLVCYGLC